MKGQIHTWKPPDSGDASEPERETCPNVISLWASMYDDYADADRARGCKGTPSLTAQDHALRVYIRERWHR